MRRLICLLVTVVLLCGANAVYAEDTVLYNNTFDSGMEGLSAVSGSDEKGGGRVVRFGGDNVLHLFAGLNRPDVLRQYLVTAGSAEWTDYDFSFKAIQHRFMTTRLAGLFRYQGRKSYYALVLHEGTLALSKNGLGPDAHLRTYSLSTTPYAARSAFDWHTYRVSLDGGTISVFIDGQPDPIIEYEDTNPIPSGKIGFGVESAAYFSAPAYFDSVLVTKP